MSSARFARPARGALGHDPDLVGTDRVDRGAQARACRGDGGAPTSPDEFVRLSKDYAAIEPVADAAREVRRLRAELEVLERDGRTIRPPSPS